MRIAGVYPFEEMKDKKVQSIFGEPVGLELVLANAKKAGHEASLFVPFEKTPKGFRKKSLRQFVEEILSFRPDVAAFSLYSCQFGFGKRIAKRLKAAMPGIKIVAGNRHPSTNAAEIAQPFDFYVIGEGEETFVELLQEMRNGQNFGKVKGIAFEEGGKARITGPRSLIQNLDSFPNAIRHEELLKQAYKGLVFPAASENPKAAIIEYSRGCLGMCKFCDNAFMWKRQVRFRSAERTAEEMSGLKERGVDVFFFMDLNFTAVPEKVFQLCDAIEETGKEFSWYCMSNIDTAEPRLLKRMKEAGCFKVNYGIESTNDSSLEKMCKGLAKEKMLKAKNCLRVLKQTQKTGLMSGGYYIIGFPWETKESMLRDASRLKNYAIHHLNIGIATPHPGTAWRQEFRETELINKWQNYDRKHLCYKHASLDEKAVLGLQSHIHRQFHSTEEYDSNVNELIAAEPRFRQSFNDYFKIIGLKKAV